MHQSWCLVPRCLRKLFEISPVSRVAIGRSSPSLLLPGLLLLQLLLRLLQLLGVNLQRALRLLDPNGLLGQVVSGGRGG